MRIEIRGDSIIVDGYVNAVERFSKPIASRTGQFIEQIVPGAFKRALESAENVDVLLNHDGSRKLSSTREGFELYEDAVGLRAVGKITDAEVVEKARKRQLTGWSFGFVPKKERTEDGEIQKRYVEDLQLLEVSILDNRKSPAYVATSISVRDEEAVITEFRGLDEDISYTEVEEPKNKPDMHEYKNRINTLRANI